MHICRAIFSKLHQVGFDGCIYPDHIFAIEGDGPDSGQALSYVVGYVKARLAEFAAR